MSPGDAWGSRVSTRLRRRGGDPLEQIDCKLDRILDALHQLATEEHNMAVTQEQFDTDLAALASSIATLIAAVDAAIAARPPADLTPEDQSVQSAAQAVSDELAKLTPATE